MTRYTIHFRGVGLLEMQGDAVREVLFPNAETTGDENDEWNDAVKIGKHPDGSPATPHYSRALSVTGAPAGYILHMKNLWVRGGVGSSPSVLTSDTKAPYASVNQLLKPSKYDLSLLSEEARRSPGRVATRFSLNGGTFRCSKPAEALWQLTDQNGITGDPAPFALWTTWTIELTSNLALEVMDLAGNEISRIVLTSTSPEICFTNFEDPSPTWSKLQQDTRPYDAGLIDDDFKWLYRMFDVSSASGSSWKNVLGANKLIAPVALEGYKPSAAGMEPIAGMPLPTVSTCFPGIWTADTVS